MHACSILIALVGTTFGQQNAPLCVALSFDQPTYALKGEAIIEVLLTNTSRQPIFVYSHLGWGESASISIWLKDATTGRDVAEQNVIHDSITPPPTSQDDFVKILPGHIYGVSIRSSISDLNIQRNGTYEVVAEYHSPIPLNLSFGLPIWSRNQPTIRSNRVTIKIGE